MGVQNRNSNNSVVYKKNRYIQPTETEKKKETEKKTSTAKTASKPASELTKTKYMTDVGMNVPVTYGVINPNEAKTQAEAKQRDTTKALTQRAVNSNANMTPVRSQGAIQREVSEYLSQTKRMSNVASVMNSRDYNNNYYSGLESMSNTMKTTNAEYRSWYYQLRKEIESNRKQNGDGWTDTMLRAIESTEPTYSYLDRTEKRLSAMAPTYKYEGVVHADDFDEYSKKGAAIKNPSYDRANQYNLKNKVSFYRDNADKISEFADKPEGQGLIYTYMTDKEVATYNYWLAKEGEKAAEKYLDIITPKLNQRYSIEMNGKTADFSRNNKFAASALSVGSNLISPIGYVEDAVRTISGKPIDIYSPAHQPSNMTNTIRNTVSDDINSGVGKWFYQNGMSLADSLATLAIGKGGALTLGLMGGSAATNAVIDAKNRGLSDKQAFALGTVAGAAEVVTEKISVEALLDKTSLGKNAVGYFIKNVLSEGSEEVGSDVINFVADILISKDKSEWETAIRNYKQQGLSDKDAFKRAALDQAEQMGLDFLGGALSGGVMGGGFYAFNAPAINSYDRTVGAQIKDRENVNTLIQTASEMDKRSEAYKLAQEINGVNTAVQENTEKHSGEADTKGEAQAIVKDFKKSNRQTQRLEKKQSKLTSDKNIGMLYRQTTSAAADNIKNNSDRMIAARLNSLGETGYGETLVKAVKKSAFGESLSIKEKKALNTSKYGQRVINELSGVTRNSGEYTSEWTQSNSDVQKFNRIGDMLNKTVKVGDQAQQVTVKGQKHKVNSFVATNEGTRVRLDNGETVKADTLTYDNKASGEIINEAAEFSAPVAKIYAENYQAGQDTADYHDSFLVAYTLGYQSAGTDVYYNEVKARVGNRISGQQAFAAYSAGQFQRRVDNEAQQVRADRKRKAKQITNITGTFDDSEVKGVELNGKQKAAVGVLRNISEITGVNVRLVQSTTDENGDYVGKNGSYDSNTNTVEIDINAGLNNIADIPELKSAMLRTASHELTHYIQHWSGAEYDTLKNSVINFLERTNGKGTVEELVQNKIDSYQNSDVKLTRDEALDEVVADSCEMMLKDSTAIQELAREDMTLVEKIKAWIDNFVNNIKKAFERVEANSTEAVILADYQADMENIQRIWDEALKKAVNNNSTLDTIDTDGGVQFSIKGDSVGYYVDVDVDQNIFSGSPEDDISIVNKYMNDRFRGKVFPLSSDSKAYVGRIGINEYSHPARKNIDTDIFEAKLKAGTELDNLLAVSTFDSHVDDTGHHPEAIGGWDYYKTVFKVGQKFYEGTVKIMIRENGREFKDITKIKETFRNASQNTKNVSADAENSFDNSISNPNENVKENKKFSLRDNYTSTRSLARDLKTELLSSLSADELDSYMKYLVDTAADVETSADFEALRDVTRSYAEAFVNSSNVKTEIDDTQKKELANYFKGKHYKMTPELRAEVEYQYGSYKDFKDKMFGKKIYFIENAETTLDKDWAEICEMFPGIFDESISDKDQPMAILEAFDGFTAVPDETAENGELIEWLTDKLVDYVTNIAKSEAAVSINPRTYGADLSSRELLANALESVAQTPAEREHLQKYQAQIDSLDEMSAQLAETRSQIHSISFTKGSDRSQLTALRNKAQILENRINVLDKKLLRFEATKVLRDVAEREKQKAIKKAKQQGRESLKDYRENRKAADIKKSIARVKSDITKRLLNPTDGRYVPPYLVQSMVDVCNAINLDTGRLAPDGRITKAQQKRNDITAALNNLRMQYDEMKKDSDSDYSSEYDSEISLALGNLINAVNGKQVREMTNTQLNEVYSLLKQIRGTLIDATQQIGLNERISNFERGMSIIDEQRHIRGVSKNIFGKYDKFVAANALNPIRNIRRMTAYNENSELAAIFNEINRGVRKADKFTMEAYKAFEDLTRDKENAKAYDEALNKAMDVDITDIDGNPVKMSKMVAMQLYMSWQRELSSGGKLSHLLNGGAIIPDFKLMSKGDIAKAVSAEYAQRIDVNQNVIDTIYEGFSDFDKAYIKAASDFFNGKAQKAINDTMRVLKHRDVATSKNYIPFKVDQDYVVKEITDLNSVQQTLTSLGMLKDITVNAGQPLVMTGLNNVLKTHIDDTARIYGLAIPVRNFNKVWNVKSHNNVSVKQQIAKNWGIEGTKVIEQTIKDIQGKRTRPNDFLTKALDTAQSAFVTSALNNNISVAIKQAASLYTAFAQLDYKPAMVGKFFKTAAQYKSIYQEIDEHTAQHWRRRQGLSTQELGDIAESVTKTSKFLNKIPTALNPTKWIQGIDCLTTATFWEMCKADVEKHTDYEVGSDEYWQAVTDMYDKVIEDTQPMYDTLHRPEVQKTTNALVRQLVMFRTQPLQNAGIIYDAYGNLKTQIMTKDKEKIKAATKGFYKACYSQFVSALVFTVMTMVANALRHNLNRYRDDDDELTEQSVLKTAVDDMANTLMGVLFPLGGSELETLISGFINGSKFGDLNLLNVPVVDFINDFFNSIKKSMDEPSVNNLKKLVINFAQMFGISAQNAYNLVNGVVLHVKDAANGEFGSFEAGLKRSNGTNYNRAVKALMEGNKDKYNNVLQELSDNGVDKDKIKSGIKSKIRDYVLDGEISQKNAEKWLKDYCGDDEAHWTVEKWKAQRENGKDYEYNKYLNLENAVKSGKQIDNEYNDLINNGEKEDTAISKVKSFALTYYLDGKISKEQALDYYGKYLGKSEDDTEKSFNSAVTGRYRNMYQDGKIDTDTLKNNLVKNGMDEEKAESKVRAWDFSEKYTTNADWSEDTINRYYNKVEPYGISVEDYDTYLVGYKDCKGTDNDGDGVTDSGSKKVQVLAVIDKLLITDEQKDVLYYLNNWSAKKIYEAPWH